MRRNKVLSRGIFLVLLLLVFFAISSCKNNSIIETDLFRVELNRESRTAIIIELTEIGKEQEILVIPQIINEHTVVQIGRQGWFGSTLIFSNNIKKIYVPYTVMGRVQIQTPNAAIIILHYQPSDYFLEYIRDNNYLASIISFSTICLVDSKPNVVFNYNFENSPNNNIYWIDYVGENIPYIIPDDPVRVGYTFIGWYLDPENINIWNDTMPLTTSETITLFAKWQVN